MNIDELIKSSGNKNASCADGGLDADVAGYIDTGSYCFNALLSGSIYGGLPDNKITAIAGVSATGKTFFAMGIAEHFLKQHPDGVILYFDSESAITSDMIKSRGMDPKKIAVFPVATVESFRHQAISIVDNYMSMKKTDQKPIIIILDSLGMLSTEKEMTDTAEGKTTRDMTRAQVIKATFRTLTIKLGAARIPMILTNHTYSSVGGLYPMQVMSGGSGLQYAASTIVHLSKKKVKEGMTVIGNIIHCKLFKSRQTIENSMVDVILDYKDGLDQYYGLVDIALELEVFKKVSTRIEMPDGTKAFEKTIYKNPEKYFTPDVMQRIEDGVGKIFMYGSDILEDDNKEETDEDVSIS